MATKKLQILGSLGTQEAIDAIEIGGRNYIFNSAFLNGSTGWGFDAGVTIDTETLFGVHPTIRIEERDATSDTYKGASTSRLPIANSFSINTGEIVTISFWYYLPTLDGFDSAHLNMQFAGTKEGASSSSAIHQFRQAKSSLVVGQWTKIEVPITATNNYTKCYINTYISRNGLIWLADFKLEKGNKVTDWTPAPEDFYTTATPIGYGTCDTDAATAEKVVTVSGGSNWTLTPGAMVCVKFTNTNTAQNPTLNVNGTGAKSIIYGASSISTSNLGYAGYANRYINYVYNGSNYVFIGWSLDSNTTYSVATQSANGLLSAADKKKLDGIAEGADAVSVTQKLTSGTEIGTVTINGTATKLYAPTSTGGNATTATTVKTTKNNDTTNNNKDFWLTFVDSDNITASDENLYTAPGLRVQRSYGTADALGKDQLIVGGYNQTKGIVSLYNGTATGSLTTNTLTDQRNWVLPDKTGTIALTSDIVDTKVNTTLATTTKAYLLGTSTTPTSTAKAVTAVSDTGVYLGTGAGTLYAEQFNANSRGGFNFIGDDFTKGDTPTSTLWWTLGMCDKTGIAHANRLGYLATAVDANGNVTTGIYAMSNVTGSTTTNGIWAGMKPDGTSYIKLGSNTVGSKNIPIYLNSGTPTSVGTSIVESKQNLGIPVTIEAGVGGIEVTNNGWFKVFEVPMAAWRSYAITMDIAPRNYINNAFAPISVTVIGRANGTGMYSPIVYLSNGDSSSILDKLYVVQNNGSATESFEIWYKNTETYSQLDFVIYNYHARSGDNNLLDRLVVGESTTPVDATTTNKTAYSFSDIAIYQSIGGNAANASALTTSAGSATQPVYFSEGKPVACTYTLDKSVPSNAVFTDNKVAISDVATTYDMYYPIMHTSTSSTGTATRAASDFSYATKDGSTTEVGYSLLQLGNETPSGTAKNKYGALRIYSQKAYHGTLKSVADLTANRDWALPNKGGTIALTSDIPTSLKNPNALTIQGNGTTLTNGVYDGSAAKTVNITPASIGAASTTLSNGTGTAGLIKTTSTVTSNSGYTACPVINGVPYYKDTNSTGYLPIGGGTLTGNLNVQTKGVTIGKNTTDNYGYIDLYYGDSICGNIFGNSTTGLTLQPGGDNAGKVGSAEKSFSVVYARTHIAQQGGQEYGRIHVQTQGTTTTAGVGSIYLGNNKASGTAGNSSGQIRLYGTSTGYTTVKAGYNSTSNITLTLPSSTGTLSRRATDFSGVIQPASGTTTKTATVSVTGYRYGIFFISAGTNSTMTGMQADDQAMSGIFKVGTDTTASSSINTNYSQWCKVQLSGNDLTITISRQDKENTGTLYTYYRVILFD